MSPKEFFPDNLYDVYKALGIPTDLLDPADTFTVHDVKDLLTELPVVSPRLRLNYFNFLFCRNAYGRCTIDDVAYDLEPGTIYYTNPGCYRTFGWNSIDSTWLITFNESYLKEYVHAEIYHEFPFLLTESLRPLRLEMEEFTEFEQWCKLLYAEQRSDSPYRKKIVGSLFVVLLLKMKARFWNDYNPIYEGNRGSQIVKTFKQDLEQHFRALVGGKAERVFRANDFAQLQHLHPSYLNNVIKSKTGKAMSVWIAEKMVAEAKSLLHDRGVSIKEVAYRLGFAESTHFSAFFKKHMGVSPVEYRKQQG